MLADDKGLAQKLLSMGGIEAPSKACSESSQLSTEPMRQVTGWQTMQV